jgi:ectoine hydroxylase-related dioxygenase (phytanoyl-CoA dioxygenase family)
MFTLPAVGLSAEQRQFFEDYGYLVVPEVVPQPLLDAVVDAVFSFLGASVDDPAGWYRGEPRRHGMVQLFQHQALWAIRQHAAVYEAFCDLLRTARLWVTVDRVNMKPPMSPGRPGWSDHGFLHWDVDPRDHPDPPWVQGVVALTATGPDQGGFQCAPDLFAELDQWLGDGDRPFDVSGFAGRHVAMDAGDLLVWNSRLPHGNSPNTSSKPRLAQYVSMRPVGDEVERRQRVSDFYQRRPPASFGSPPGALDREPGPPPDLTVLGRRLLGLDEWPADGSL